MFEYELKKDHYGPVLIADSTTFSALRKVVKDVADRSPLLSDEDRANVLRGLAHDARKACERQPPSSQPEPGVRYGVDTQWPVLLIQQRVLRQSLAYMDHSKLHQAMTYALESVIEDSLREDFGGDAEAGDHPAMANPWRRLGCFHTGRDRGDRRAI
ncbi:MAG: hypothetical protein LBJ59_03240 [Zoogloeaceae bacterium]|jgi:hypothetical protein|nr:hypothetical protein [Zoogloeaceae bacterium]